MKSITCAIIAAAVLATSTVAFAGSPKMVTNNEAASLQKIGIISSQGFTSFDDLDASLSMKAGDIGATHYLIIGTTGNNKIGGTAVAYR